MTTDLQQETKPPADPKERTFDLGINPTTRFGDNSIRTAKYTPLTFLPLDIGIQFTKVANIYFVFLGILQMMPVLNSNPIPSILLSLTCVVSLSVIKDLVENMKAWKRDAAENDRMVNAFEGDSFKNVRSESLRVGSIVKVS